MIKLHFKHLFSKLLITKNTFATCLKYCNTKTPLEKLKLAYFSFFSFNACKITCSWFCLDKSSLKNEKSWNFVIDFYEHINLTCACNFFFFLWS